MDSSDKLIANVYNFLNLPLFQQEIVINDLTQSFVENNKLKWPRHRCHYVIELCKELANVPMTHVEIEHLRNIRHKFESISSIEDLDTCLMFWQITKDVQYWNRIQVIANDPYHKLVSHASIII